MGLLDGRVVLVVGGTAGLGAGIAKAAAQAGAEGVAVTGRRAGKGAAVAARLEALGAAALFVEGDVASTDDAKAMVAQTISRFGRIDCLVNAAGITTRGSLLETTPELFDQHIAINLRGPFFTMQAAVADMVCLLYTSPSPRD